MLLHGMSGICDLSNQTGRLTAEISGKVLLNSLGEGWCREEFQNGL